MCKKPGADILMPMPLLIKSVRYTLINLYDLGSSERSATYREIQTKQNGVSAGEIIKPERLERGGPC
jgi:hypothetical protein